MKTSILPFLLSATFVLSSNACVNKPNDASATQAASTSGAFEASSPNISLGSLSFLTPSTVSITKVISPVPQAGSDADKIDNGVLHMLQSARSSEECARAATEVVITLDSFMGPAYGPLTAAEVTQLSPLFNKLVPEAKYYSGQAKLIWNRPRPYVEDKTLTPCVDPENSGAYPSGHATVARVFAQILKTVYPDRATDFMARADEVALDRVLGGVHHPSDVIAGQKLADAVAAALLQNDKFKSALVSATSSSH